MTKKKPVLGITMGDPAGIGAEIIVRSLAVPNIREACYPVVIGDLETMRKTADEMLKMPVEFYAISEIKREKLTEDKVAVLDMKNVTFPIPYRQVDEQCGRAALDFIRKSAELANAHIIDAIVTGPIHKESINLAGAPYAGHTEAFADLTNTEHYAMMLVEENFRVVHVSTHVSLRQACERATKERVLHTITLAHDACKRMKIAEPRIVVAGLNPHSGEGGLFGTEEIDHIIPAIEEAKKMGMDVTGPIPPDTVFSRAKGGLFDAAIAMYHDQGHIAMKVASFQWDQEKQAWTAIKGVNVTLGLPVIRTSVDHGVAFGKAGKGIANPESMIEAIELAALMAS
jgi:4-hydroxythreonine-4-phosphate dehydrogenase